jgi:hypothetical protein
VSPRPTIHPDFAALAALPPANQESERFADPEASTPQQHDHRVKTLSVRAIADRAHHGDDFLDSRRVSRVVLALVARWAAAVIARHRRRRAPMSGSVQHD